MVLFDLSYALNLESKLTDMTMDLLSKRRENLHHLIYGQNAFMVDDVQQLFMGKDFSHLVTDVKPDHMSDGVFPMSKINKLNEIADIVNKTVRFLVIFCIG